MDYRSFYLPYENGVWFANQNVVSMIKKDFEDTFTECIEITYEEWVARPVTMKAKQAVLNLFSTMF